MVRSHRFTAPVLWNTLRDVAIYCRYFESSILYWNGKVYYVK